MDKVDVNHAVTELIKLHNNIVKKVIIFCSLIFSKTIIVLKD